MKPQSLIAEVVELAILLAVLYAFGLACRSPAQEPGTNWVEITTNDAGAVRWHICGPAPKTAQEAVEILQKAGLPERKAP